jgi:hypothetical protein
LSLNSHKYGFGIQDPGSEIRDKPIPDPGVKKAPDPGSGSATLFTNKNVTAISNFFSLETVKISGPCTRKWRKKQQKI